MGRKDAGKKEKPPLLSGEAAFNERRALEGMGVAGDADVVEAVVFATIGTNEIQLGFARCENRSGRLPGIPNGLT